MDTVSGHMPASLCPERGQHPQEAHLPVSTSAQAVSAPASSRRHITGVADRRPYLEDGGFGRSRAPEVEKAQPSRLEPPGNPVTRTRNFLLRKYGKSRWKHSFIILNSVNMTHPTINFPLPRCRTGPKIRIDSMRKINFHHVKVRKSLGTWRHGGERIWLA